MKRYYTISFSPIFRELVGAIYAFDLTNFFTPNLFIDCIIQYYADMNINKGTNEIRRLTLNQRDLLDFLDEFTPQYMEDGSFYLPEGVSDLIHEKRQEISSILNKINFFLLNEATDHHVNLRLITGFQSLGSVYVLELEE